MRQQTAQPRTTAQAAARMATLEAKVEGVVADVIRVVEVTDKLATSITSVAVAQQSMNASEGAMAARIAALETQAREYAASRLDYVQKYEARFAGLDVRIEQIAGTLSTKIAQAVADTLRDDQTLERREGARQETKRNLDDQRSNAMQTTLIAGGVSLFVFLLTIIANLALYIFHH